MLLRKIDTQYAKLLGGLVKVSMLIAHVNLDYEFILTS